MSDHVHLTFPECVEILYAEIARLRDWIKAANQFAWAHEKGCPAEAGGSACTCGLNQFLGRPRPFIESYKAELDRMRTAMEDAPHDRNCNGAFGRDPLYPCDCWKSRALNPQQAQQEKA